MCKELKRRGAEDYITKATGLKIDAYFSATKIKWILDNVKGAKEKARRGELLFGTIDTYFLYRLSGGKIFATDLTNASRLLQAPGEGGIFPSAALLPLSTGCGRRCFCPVFWARFLSIFSPHFARSDLRVFMLKITRRGIEVVITGLI